jgi:hypothetical protein
VAAVPTRVGPDKPPKYPTTYYTDYMACGSVSLQEERRRYEAVIAKLLAAAEANNKALATELFGEIDDWRDDFDHKIDAARGEMRRLAGAAIVGTRAYQRHVVQIGLALLADLRRLRRFERGKLLTSFGPTLEGLHYTGAGGAI